MPKTKSSTPRENKTTTEAASGSPMTRRSRSSPSSTPIKSDDPSTNETNTPTSNQASNPTTPSISFSPSNTKATTRSSNNANNNNSPSSPATSSSSIPTSNSASTSTSTTPKGKTGGNEKAGSSPTTKRTYNAFVLNKHKYSVGDPIMVQSKGPNPYIAQIGKIEANPNDSKNVTLTLNWYYRPDEIKGGRRDYHGKDELIKSNHQDKCHVQCVNGPCRVLGLDEYLEYKAEPEEEVFYQREDYDAFKQVITTVLPSYCICKKPQNPDKAMILCDSCENWYHVDCVKISKQELEKQSYSCPNCTKLGLTPKEKKDRKGRPTSIE